MHTPTPRALALRASEVTYPGVTERIRAVRADLRLLLRDCPMADEIILCVSELAANAALHSNSRLPGGTFTVRIAISPGTYARIEVEDNGGPWSSVSTESTGNHGLDIVRALAADWGVHGDYTTRTTWAIFKWPPDCRRPGTQSRAGAMLACEDFLHNHQGHAFGAPGRPPWPARLIGRGRAWP
jgi:hypothetical protein